MLRHANIIVDVVGILNRKVSNKKLKYFLIRQNNHLKRRRFFSPAWENPPASLAVRDLNKPSYYRWTEILLLTPKRYCLSTRTGLFPYERKYGLYRPYGLALRHSKAKLGRFIFFLGSFFRTRTAALTTCIKQWKHVIPRFKLLLQHHYLNATCTPHQFEHLFLYDDSQNAIRLCCMNTL